MNVIGIDVGGSTTKIVCVSNGKVLVPMQVKATDPLTSVYGAFGKYLSEEGLTAFLTSPPQLTAICLITSSSSL